MASMSGKLCIVTGGTSGIGKETARGLVRLGAKVAIVARNPKKAQATTAELNRIAVTPIDVLEADMASLDQVRSLAGRIRQTYQKIDVLVNNAGVYRLRRHTTEDGYEETFAVNHLAPFLLTNLLLDHLRERAPARIVTVASNAHLGFTLDFADLHSEQSFKSFRVYGRTKLANIMFTYALARRIEGSGVTVNALHPGFVASNFGSGNRLPVQPVMLALRPFVLSPARGARTSIWLASTPDVEEVNGKYFTNSKIPARANREVRSNPFSYDEDAQERLWKESAAMVGLE